jgi:Tol biopolymer transport system component
LEPGQFHSNIRASLKKVQGKPLVPKKRFRTSLSLVIFFLLSSCTIDVAQSVVVNSHATAVAIVVATDEAKATAPPKLDRSLPIQKKTFTPAAAGDEPSANISPIPTNKIPVTWSVLNLTGKLVFLNAAQKDTNPILSVQELDLGSGELTTIFQGADLSWIYSLAVSPDGRQLILCYTAPPGDGLQQTQTLYQMPMDGSAQLKELIPASDPEDQFLQPEWSPDGKFLYFSHVNYKTVSKTQHFPTFDIFRIAFPSGNSEKIADQAFWPRLSRDGAHLVYISSDISTGKNQVILADPDGKNAQVVPMSGAVVPDIIDAPVFSPDGKTILFSAPSPPRASLPIGLDRLFGVTIVNAHSVPSEWWSVPVGGGPANQLTNLQFAGLFASLAPDEQHFASYSASGLFVMNPDASGVTMIIDDLGGIYGTVSWLP